MKLLGATIPARDPQALADWYAHGVGRMPLAFEPGEASPQHVAFHVADLAAWRERLDVPLLRGDDGADEFDFSNWGGARSIYFEDPEGNVVELVARPDARPELSLAEVGLPTDDVAAAVDALDRELGLPHFDGDRASFSAVGDPDGLLIVVTVGRGWFPTHVPAGGAAVAVRLAADDGAGERELVLPGSRHRVTLS